MMRGKSSVYSRVSESGSMSAQTTSASDDVAACEVRPGGMLVQKRTDQPENLGKIVRIRVAYGKLRYEISVNSQSTFGELKKLLVRDTGLQPGEQKLIFKGKERENGAYLDMCGVKDRSKVELLEDPLCRERRIVESRKSAKIQSVQRALADISAEVDRLAGQISTIKKSISSGNKVPEVQITTLIELLMRQAIKLDGISTIGSELSAAKNLQGKRVQKSVETLDLLKVENANVKPVIISTKWETFEFDPPPSTAARWELFD
uniref:Ubiquitin-like domain-containing protein n=1 Tax=Kalanchoe fedtschenkoi TaxID=63787 RepID=A0A7N0VGP1_KALFE